MRRLSKRITRIERTASARSLSLRPAWIDRERAAMCRLMSCPTAYDAALDLEEAAHRAGTNSGAAWARTDPAAVRLGEKLIERVTELGGRF